MIFSENYFLTSFDFIAALKLMSIVMRSIAAATFFFFFFVFFALCIKISQKRFDLLKRKDSELTNNNQIDVSEKDGRRLPRQILQFRFPCARFQALQLKQKPERLHLPTHVDAVVKFVINRQRKWLIFCPDQLIAAELRRNKPTAAVKVKAHVLVCVCV